MPLKTFAEICSGDETPLLCRGGVRSLLRPAPGENNRFFTRVLFSYYARAVTKRRGPESGIHNRFGLFCFFFFFVSWVFGWIGGVCYLLFFLFHIIFEIECVVFCFDWCSWGLIKLIFKKLKYKIIVLFLYILVFVYECNLVFFLIYDITKPI